VAGQKAILDATGGFVPNSSDDPATSFAKLQDQIERQSLGADRHVEMANGRRSPAFRATLR